MPKRERYLFVCVNRRPDGNPKGSCAQSGSEAIHAALKEEIAKRGLHKTKIRACTSSCIDLCHVGPTIAVEPDHVFYGHVTLADVPEIVEGLAKGEHVQRLVVPEGQFDPPPVLVSLGAKR
jgi:(2Fe-2S) ferredoxin